MRRAVIGAILVGLAAVLYGSQADSSGTRAAPPTWQEDIRPIFERHCVMCHGDASMLPQGVPNGLRLDTYESVMQGSNYFPVVQPGEPENSTLVAVVRNGTMPPRNYPIPPLTDSQIAVIEAWVEAGAPERRPDQ